MPDRHQCGRAFEAFGANCFRRRVVAGDAGAQGECRGGGISRAGKRARKTPVPRTLVFDEIDIGIGGRAAEAVGQKLKELSRAQQVLCVTHLPQIAAFADQHFLVEKQERQGTTKTSVRLLKDEERTEEVARMLSGAKLTDTSLRHAEQMLKTSRKAVKPKFLADVELGDNLWPMVLRTGQWIWTGAPYSPRIVRSRFVSRLALANYMQFP